MQDDLWQERPVVTFAVADTWLAIHVQQIERVIELEAESIFRPPHLRQEYLGLVPYADGLVPLLRLGAQVGPDLGHWSVVVLAHGQRLALPIERTGLLYGRYQMDAQPPPLPRSVRDYDVQPIAAAERTFWLVNTNSLLPMAA